MRDRPPFWVSLSASAIRRLPFGRYQTANALRRFAGAPFLASLPGDLGGFRFICDLHDTISREVCFTGRYEPQETQLVQRLLRPGMVVVDVGANWGYFTLVCAHLVGPSGRVIALEPHPRLASMLSANIADNVVLSEVVAAHRVAAGARSESKAFVGFDERDGNWGVSRAALGTEVPDFESRTVALDLFLDALFPDAPFLNDAFVADCRRSRVDLVKIDIEGAEADAIRGMAGGIERHRYRYVLLECHPAELARLGTTVEQCLAPFRRAGYRGWHIDHSAGMHRRAARRAVPTAELLAPIDDRLLASDQWPHLLWAAPGEALPA
jgi:FkbM family methyltransferase